jgi:hypothetical protein
MCGHNERIQRINGQNTPLDGCRYDLVRASVKQDSLPASHRSLLPGRRMMTIDVGAVRVAGESAR